MEINCVFSVPVNIQPNPRYTENWAFSEIDCSMPDFSTSSTSTLPEYFEKIISTSTPENYFFVQKTIDYGDLLILGFFILFFVFSIGLAIKDLIFKTILK